MQLIVELHNVSIIKNYNYILKDVNWSIITSICVLLGKPHL